MMETNRRTGTKPALSGWLLVYVEYTIIVFAMRGLSIYFILTGDIGIMANSGDFRFQFWSSVALELLSAAVLALIWLRRRHAPAVAVFREAALPAVVAARALLFGADSIWVGNRRLRDRGLRGMDRLAPPIAARPRIFRDRAEPPGRRLTAARNRTCRTPGVCAIML